VPAHGYLLCATPRTGSTRLCQLLASTGLLGHPESYFREEDEEWWCTSLSVEASAGHARSFHAFAGAVQAAATTPNGVFGARVMSESLIPTVNRLRRFPGERDLAVLERSLGPLAFVFLTRGDTIDQAVSWCKAEQTQFWQVGDVPSGPATFDLPRLRELVATIDSHNNAWKSWFQQQAVVPLAITYHDVVNRPHFVVQEVARLVDVALPRGLDPVSSAPKLADAQSRAWADALRRDLGHPSIEGAS
jgi:LPS sulfotransferase NodH